MACCRQVSGAGRPPADWQATLAASIREPAELCRMLGLPSDTAAEARSAVGDFPLLVPRPYVARILARAREGRDQRSRLFGDPLLLQVLPRAAETAAVPGYGPDPLGEAAACGGSGLLHKYRGRALIVTTGACAVHCRFCFRRHFPYADSHGPGADAGRWSPALEKIAADPSIHEAILSGGDPLMLPDDAIASLIGQLGEIPHLRRLRVHSRMPVVVPERVTDGLLATLRGGRLSAIMVVHVNHPGEIDADVAAAFTRLVDAGVPVLSQSVLLRGVNDGADVLAELCERLLDLRVMPYYLHQLDAVAGAAHFAVPIEVGAAIMADVRARVPGCAVPRYVRETPGGVSKEPLA